MKQICLSLIFCGALLGAASGANATIWRLNNSNGGTLTPAINASFPTATTLQQAHDNAGVLAGDTIHVEQSNTSYGALTMTKKLTIIGAGYFLNMNPKTQVNQSYGSPVGSITMNAATCAGSTITGLTINGQVQMGTNRLFVLRNYIPTPGSAYAIIVGSGSASNIDSAIISQNYLYSNYGIAEQSGTTGNVTNLIMANNYIYGYYNSVNLSGHESGILKNNVLVSYLNIFNFYVVNNISTYTSTNTLNNCVVEYNLGYTAANFTGATGANNTFTTGTNLTNTNPGFVGGTTSTDGAFALTNASPAKTTGKSGEDMGIFGGTLPYVLSGIPTVPNIYALTIAPIAAGATSISVTVSTKSN